MKKLENPVIEKDIVLIHIEGEPQFFARVEGFTPDKKPNWWQVKLLILQVPLLVATWILRHEQINGEEFTMQGRTIRMEKVEAPETRETPAELNEVENHEIGEITQKEKKKQTGKQARILSLGGKNETIF